MAAVAPPPPPAAAPAAPKPAAAPAPAAPAADQATDLLQKLSLDSQPKAADATEPAGAKKQGAAASQPLSVSIPPERSITPVLQDFMDPNLFYLPAYYYGGYDGSMSEWDDYPRYVNPDGVEIAPAVYGDIYGYGYAPYGAYSPASSPVPTVDGQMFGPQHYQYPTAYQGCLDVLYCSMCYSMVGIPGNLFSMNRFIGFDPIVIGNFDLLDSTVMRWLQIEYLDAFWAIEIYFYW